MFAHYNPRPITCSVPRNASPIPPSVSAPIRKGVPVGTSGFAVSSRFGLEELVGAILVAHTVKASLMVTVQSARVLRRKPHLERILASLCCRLETHVFHENGFVHLASSAAIVLSPSLPRAAPPLVKFRLQLAFAYLIRFNQQATLKLRYSPRHKVWAPR